MPETTNTSEDGGTGGMSEPVTHEVVLLGLDAELNEKEEVYGRFPSEGEARAAVELLRRSMSPFVIVVREVE